MRRDERDKETIISENRWPPNPVVAKGLVQVIMGSPQPIYNGGLLRGTVRYFDRDRCQPGLPGDVAALVDEVAFDKVGVHLYNLNADETRNVIIQAGAYGEHSFTAAHWSEQDQENLKRDAKIWLREEIKYVQKTASVDGKYVAVRLLPGTGIRLDLGMKRFANSPGYTQPWQCNEFRMHNQRV